VNYPFKSQLIASHIGGEDLLIELMHMQNEEIGEKARATELT